MIQITFNQQKGQYFLDIVFNCFPLDFYFYNLRSLIQKKLHYLFLHFSIDVDFTISFNCFKNIEFINPSTP